MKKEVLVEVVRSKREGVFEIGGTDFTYVPLKRYAESMLLDNPCLRLSVREFKDHEIKFAEVSKRFRGGDISFNTFQEAIKSGFIHHMGENRKIIFDEKPDTTKKVLVDLIVALKSKISTENEHINYTMMDSLNCLLERLDKLC